MGRDDKRSTTSGSKKRKWLEPTETESKETILKKGSSFGRWCYPSVLKIEN